MNLLKFLRKQGLVLWLLAIMIGLRGLIAPRFMLDTSGDGPLGLSIVFCEGLNGNTFPLPSANSTTDHHQHHGSDSSAPETTTGMVGHSCALWSISSLYMESVVAVSHQLFLPDSDLYETQFVTLLASIYFRQPQQPRAPPVTSLIA